MHHRRNFYHPFNTQTEDRDTEGTAIRMSVDTSTVYIRNQSTLSHLLYTQAHTSSIMEFLCMEAFIRLMAVKLDLMILVYFFYFLYAVDKS